MGVLQINSSVFPLVMSVALGKPDSDDLSRIDLPRGANILYLQTLDNDLEKTYYASMQIIAAFLMRIMRICLNFLLRMYQD